MRICIVAGGTGGHIVPALAVAEKFKGEKIFVTGRSRTSEKRFIESVSPDEKTIIKFINVKPIIGKGLKSAYGFLSSISALKESYEFIKSLKPDVVIGFGGYVSGPVCLAGKILKKRVFVHEQNSVMGFANRIISTFCDGVLTSFEKTEAPSFASRKFIHVGFPLRNVFKEYLKRGFDEKEKTDNKIKIFVTGGSQGAIGLNQLFLEALGNIVSFYPELKEKLMIFHQTGDAFFEIAKEFFSSWCAEVFPFTDRFGFFLGLSDIVIARAGAGTVFEIAFARRPSIFVPLPRSAGNHQEKNPKYLLGDACFIVKQNEKHRFEINLFDLITNGKLRDEMHEKLKKVQVEDGSFRILEVVLERG